MVDVANTATAISIGQQIAEKVIQQRNLIRARRAELLRNHPDKIELNVAIASAAGPLGTGISHTVGFLVAAGDSWFDYPFHDVLQVLEDNYGYNTESAAHRGDPIEAMAYQGGQLDKFARCLEKIAKQGATPKAVLLSGGGNDIAGNEFGMLLNNATSAIGGWNDDIVDGVLNQRISTAYKSMVASITRLCEQYVGKALPILIHGYDYPVPDGRGFGGGWPFPGPWLQPGFQEKLFSDLATNTTLMHGIIDRFNAMLAQFASNPVFANVHYVDLRGTLSSVLANDAYKDSWDNELHPTQKGFEAVTTKFARVLSAL